MRQATAETRDDGFRKRIRGTTASGSDGRERQAEGITLDNISRALGFAVEIPENAVKYPSAEHFSTIAAHGGLRQMSKDAQLSASLGFIA